MSNDEFDDQDFRGWKFDAPNREHLLERRVKELEDTVSRLEKELSRQRQSYYDRFTNVGGEIKAGSIGAIGGTIGSMGGAVPPLEPHKAD